MCAGLLGRALVSPNLCEMARPSHWAARQPFYCLQAPQGCALLRASGKPPLTRLLSIRLRYADAGRSQGNPAVGAESAQFLWPEAYAGLEILVKRLWQSNAC
jgi:hypothetical protein